MREKPLSPPSVTTTNKKVNYKMGAAIKELFTNKNYILLQISFNLVYGIQKSLGTVLAGLTIEYGYPMKYIVMMNVLEVIAGMTNTFVCGKLLDKYKAYKKMIIFICFGALVSCGFHLFTL